MSRSEIIDITLCVLLAADFAYNLLRLFKVL